MEVKYEFFEDEGLFIQQYKGDFSIADYTLYMNFLIEMEEWKFVKKVFSDFRNINLNEALKNLDELATYREQTIKKKYLNVFLVNDPRTTVITSLYQEILNRYDYNYCSTLGYAIKLLRIKKSEKELGFILNNLKNTF